MTASFNGRSSGRAAGASVRFRNTAAPSTSAAAHPAQPIRKVLRFIRSASPLCADVLHLSAHRDVHRGQGVLHFPGSTHFRVGGLPVGNHSGIGKTIPLMVMTANRKVTEMMRRAGTPKASISSLAENSPSSCRGKSRNTAVPHRANTMPVGNSTFHACFTRSDCLLP